MNLETFTSFSGRIPRKTFWLGVVALWILSMVLWFILAAVFGVSMMGAQSSDPEAAMQALSQMALPLGIMTLLTLWPSLALYTKRWHDRNKSGWWSLIMFVPIIGGLWMLIECGFLRGTEGSNRYGPDPIRE